MDVAPYPQPGEGYVTDNANLLTDEQETQLESRLYDCEQETGVEVAVVTIGSIADYPGTANDSVEAFARGLFDRYGIGNMPKNDGMLLLVAVNDREARIELGDGYGSGREREAERIMQNVIVPQFRNGRYDMGIMNGVESILQTFAGRDAAEGQQAASPQRTTPRQTQPLPSDAPRPVQNDRPASPACPWGIIGLIVVGVVVMIIVKRMTKTKKALGTAAPQISQAVERDGGGIVPSGGLGKGLLNALLTGGLLSGQRGRHNGGIHFGGMSSRNRGIDLGALSSRIRGTGFGNRRPSGGLGGGFGGGFSGSSSRSRFGGGFSRGGGATGKW
jgi:uncharacterized membrane protein YgcG